MHKKLQGKKFEVARNYYHFYTWWSKEGVSVTQKKRLNPLKKSSHVVGLASQRRSREEDATLARETRRRTLMAPFPLPLAPSSTLVAPIGKTNKS